MRIYVPIADYVLTFVRLKRLNQLTKRPGNHITKKARLGLF
jgi:hypothetical protein